MAEDSNASPGFGQSLIPVINKLQDIFAQLGSGSTIDLPQVAVVGSQSSGKSSVLEALVGRDFLPRGSNICTRRPLVLQLVQVPQPAEEWEYVEWGEFLHLPGRTFTDFSAIEGEIQAETEREVGANMGISDKPIRLKIFSPYVLNITLVDLPGITKVPVGDQPADIEARIRTMVMSYITNPSCIILAVSPANSDLANSDALQIARVADIDGSRTIGVITKLDIMDRGTDASNLLLGNVIPLRLGYIGVVNRSQEDIIANKSIRDALASEEKYFHSCQVYHSLSEHCGIPQLAKKLNQVLEKHIRQLLPYLKAQIYAQMTSVKKELSSYGEITETEIRRGALLLNILKNFSDAFKSGIEGKNEEILTSELAGGARIHYIFQSLFVKRLDDVDPCDDLTDKDIQTSIQNAIGLRSALFVPEVPFQVLLRRQIARLLDPSLQCVHFIYEDLVKLAHRCETRDLLRFPVLQMCLEEVVGSLLRECLVPTETMVRYLIEMEMDYINTSHPSFIGGSKAMAIVAQQQQKRSLVGSVPTTRTKEADCDRVPAIDKFQKSRHILARAGAPGFVANNVIRQDKSGANGNTYYGNCGISSIFGIADSIASGNHGELIPSAECGELIPPSECEESIPSSDHEESISSADHEEAIPSVDHWESTPSVNGGESFAFGNGSFVTNENSDHAHNVGHLCDSSMIQLKEPPAVLSSIEAQSELVGIGIGVTKMLLRSYYDIVRKNIQDKVPKAIMHFLVNRAKRELYNFFIKNLYREDLFAEMLEEREDIASRRKQCNELLLALQQAVRTLEELPLDLDSLSK